MDNKENYHPISRNIGSGPYCIAKATCKIIQLCWLYKVSLLIAHLERPSFAAVLANSFITASVVVFRHHSDYAILAGFSNNFSYKFTYRFAPIVVVVSNYAKKVMTECEHIKPNKIIVLPLALDFKLFGNTSEENIKNIKEKYSSELLLLSVGRLTQLKRPYHSIEVVKRLLKDNIRVKLILLGTGDEQSSVTRYIKDNGLEEHVFLCGFSNEVQTFMKAADFILHPSVSESSSIVIKEAGIARKPCIVCQGVGDFDEYLINLKNCFFVPREKFIETAVATIKSNYQNKNFLAEIGEALHADITRLFDINNVISFYETVMERNKH